MRRWISWYALDLVKPHPSLVDFNLAHSHNVGAIAIHPPGTCRGYSHMLGREMLRLPGPSVCGTLRCSRAADVILCTNWTTVSDYNPPRRATTLMQLDSWPGRPATLTCDFLPDSRSARIAQVTQVTAAAICWCFAWRLKLWPCCQANGQHEQSSMPTVLYVLCSKRLQSNKGRF